MDKNEYDLYIGVMLDGMFKQHIENTEAKLKIRNNIIQKLAGSF